MRKSQVIVLSFCFIATIISCSSPTGESKVKGINTKHEVGTVDTKHEVGTVDTKPEVGTVYTKPEVDTVDTTRYPLVTAIDFKNTKSTIVYYKIENKICTFYMDEYPTIETMKIAEFKNLP